MRQPEPGGEMSKRNNRQALRKSALSLALGACLSMAMPIAHAANADGSVAGRTRAGATVTVVSPDTGFTRTVTADADGNYRFPFLPVGKYTLQSSADGTPIGEQVVITVSLGVATSVDIGGATGTLDTVAVNASSLGAAVDVSSVESATNIGREELGRLPVERDPQAVALLAPGVVAGEFGGIS